MVCPAVHADFALNYRREVMLARELAARGLAVLRFHFRGLGNSDRDPADMSFDSMVEDAHAAAGQLRARTGVEHLAAVGTRFGGLVAGAAYQHPVSLPLALWDPTTDVQAHFREAARVLLMQGVRDGADDRPSFERLVEEIDGEGWADVLGYSVDRLLYESSSGKTLVRALGSAARSVFLAQLGQTSKLRPAFEAVALHVRSLGGDVEVLTLRADDPWWFTNPAWVAEEARETTRRLIDATADWLERVIGDPA